MGYKINLLPNTNLLKKVGVNRNPAAASGHSILYPQHFHSNDQQKQGKYPPENSGG